MRTDERVGSACTGAEGCPLIRVPSDCILHKLHFAGELPNLMRCCPGSSLPRLLEECALSWQVLRAPRDRQDHGGRPAEMGGGGKTPERGEKESREEN